MEICLKHFLHQFINYVLKCQLIMAQFNFSMNFILLAKDFYHIKQDYF